MILEGLPSVTLSPLDDYPVHQIPEVMRHVGTSDRNFYDRYYFNAFPLTGDTMLIVGLGQYPNLGVTDAFALLRRGSAHRVVRASRELGADRMNTRVGPFGVEVLEGLKRLRVVLGPNEHGLSFDLTWEGIDPAAGRAAALHPRAGTGGVRLQAHGADRAVDRVDHGGRRDARGDAGPMVGDQGPVLGHPAGRGARAAGHPGAEHGHVLLALRAGAVRGSRDLVHRPGGRSRGRLLEEAVRVWPDGTSEYLGRPTYTPSYAEGTRDVVSARIGFSPPGGKPFDMEATLLLPVHLMVGTGYGLEPDWRHGMYQGTNLVVQGVGYDLSRPEDAARMWGMVDAVGRFDYDGHTGYGLYEYWALGDHPSFRYRNGQYPSADRCIALQVAAAFSTQEASSRSLRNRIDAMMTQTRPTELHQRRILMTRRPAAAAECPSPGPRDHPRLGDPGRSGYRGPAHQRPGDPRHHRWNSETITLAVRCSHDQLRVDVYDTSLPLPIAVDEQAINADPARAGARRLPGGRVGLIPDLHR